MSHKIDAIILNPQACAGRAAIRWKTFLNSEYAKALSASHAPLFDGIGIQNTKTLQEELKNWILNRIQDGCQNFAVAGGDGTVHLAINTVQALPIIHKNKIRLGAIALGSSNDFHKPFRSQGRKDVGPIQCRLEFGSAFPHDLGQVEFYTAASSASDSKKAVFAINSSIGMTAEANYFFNTADGFFKKVKSHSTQTAILWAALSEFVRYEKFPLQIQVGENPPFQTSVVNLGVVKNPHFSGDFRYDRAEQVDSGSFGVHLCGNMNRLQTLRTLQSLKKGKFSGLPLTSSWSSPSVQVSSNQEFSIETDGEIYRAKGAQFTVLKREISLCP